MGFTQDFLTSRRNIDDGSTRVGEHDRLWYSSSDNTIRIGDNVTPGGILVCGGGGDGNYILPTASTTVKGGVKIDGTSITIANEIISGFDGNYNSLSNKPVLFSGDYNDLSNKPTIPPAQVNSDWNATSGVAEILNKPTIPDITNITDVFAATHEPMGHEDNTKSAISFNNADRTFTITPVNGSYNIWVKGTKIVISTAKSVTIPNTNGLYYIYFDSTGTLNYKTTFYDWPNDCMTAYVYWNALTGKAPFVADERHGITLDWQTHEYLHRTRGAAIASGFTATNYIVGGDGSLDSHLQLDIAAGTFFDEDLQVDIIDSQTPAPNTWQQDLSGPSRIPMFYINSGGGWVMDPATAFPVKQGLLPKYNLLNGGGWTTPDIDNNKFGVTFIIATNNINYPILGIIGQSAHANQGDAEAVNFTDLSLPGFPIVEFRTLYKLVFQCKTSYTNTVNARLVSVFDLRSFSSTTSAIATYTDHGALSGLSDDDHPQYLLKTDLLDNGVTTNGNFVTAASGVGSSFFPKVQSGFNAAFDTVTTMDNLSVRIHLVTGNTGRVELSAVTGSFAAYVNVIGNVTGHAVTGDSSAVTFNIAAGSWTAINSTYDIASGGDTLTMHVIDTTNSRIYRVTAIHCQSITGAYVAIERMV